MQHDRRLWQLAAMLMVAGSFASLVWLALPGSDLSFNDPVTPLLVVVLPPLIILFVPLLAWSDLELGWKREAKGELERLLAQKHDGSMARRARRVPDRAARVRHGDSVPPLQSGGEDVGLDRLVRLKHQGDLAGRATAADATSGDSYRITAGKPPPHG